MGWSSFLTNLYNGKIRTHADGRKWKYNSSKGTWKVEKTDPVAVGNTGPTGPQGPMGPQGPEGTMSDTINSKLYINGPLGVYSSNPCADLANDFQGYCKSQINDQMVTYSHGHWHFNGVVTHQGTYIRRVMLLFSLSNTNEGLGPRRMVNGRFTKFRSNGCCSQRDNILDLQCHKNYNSEDLYYNINHQHNIPLVTCTFNGEKYAAINLNYGLPHGCEVLFEGFFSDTDVFGTNIEYYDVRGTVLNSEINNSITVIS